MNTSKLEENQEKQPPKQQLTMLILMKEYMILNLGTLILLRWGPVVRLLMGCWRTMPGSVMIYRDRGSS